MSGEGEDGNHHEWRLAHLLEPYTHMYMRLCLHSEIVETYHLTHM
jgi:hypothetical protein